MDRAAGSANRKKHDKREIKMRKIFSKTALILMISIIMAAMFSLAGCGDDQGGTSGTAGSAGGETELESRDFFAMDTYMTVSSFGEGAGPALAECEAMITGLETEVSTEIEDSEIAQLNKNGSGTLTGDSLELVKEALEIYDQTDGAFNIAVYPIMKAWGFTNKDYKVPSEDTLKDLLKATDLSTVSVEEKPQASSDPAGSTGTAETGGASDSSDSAGSTDTAEAGGDAGEAAEISFAQKGMEIDLGGITKGLASSRSIDIMKKAGLSGGLVNLGGNVQTFGEKPDGSLWHVAVQSPYETDDYLGIIEVTDKAVITSGGYERFFEKDGKKYHHIMDPSTGHPAESGLISSTIISDNGVLADGLSTALFVMGEEKAEEFWRSHKDQFDFILMDEDDQLYVTEPIADSFTSEQYDITVVK